VRVGFSEYLKVIAQPKLRNGHVVLARKGSWGNEDVLATQSRPINAKRLEGTITYTTHP